MLFRQRFWAGMADGTITCTFRRWRRPQVVAGRPYRTPAGMILVDAVDVVSEEDITHADAQASGYEDVASLCRDLRPPADDVRVYRIRFHPGGEDPRDALAATATLDDAELAELRRRLARLDRASPRGPWTAETLDIISRRPAVRAADLAEELGRERADLKLDVRKLKALGLTISLERGYRLSPRGEAFRAAP